MYLDEVGADAKIKELDAKFAKTPSPLTAAAITAKTVPAAGVAQASPVARAVSPVFNKDLTKGARGADVKRLQELFGVEATGFFGALTEKAIKVFQVKHGVVKSEQAAGAGRLGPATRAKLQEVFGAPSAAISAPSGAGAVGPAPTVTRRLGVGLRGADVKALQAYLGVEASGYYGQLTRKAVQQFQEKYSIAKPGDQGYGDVGPLTRTILNAMSSTPASPEPSIPAVDATAASRREALQKQLEEAQKRLDDLLKQRTGTQ